MEIKQLGMSNNGIRSFEIRVNTIPYHALIRYIRKIPGAVVNHSKHNPMNDNVNINISYKDVTINIETPFSDYIINCSSSSKAFDEFISIMQSYNMNWWEKYF